MKTIKFFSLALLLSIAWVSCKNASTSSTETASAEAVADSLFAVSKTTAQTNMGELQTLLTAKVTELESAIASATDATKAGLTAQLGTYQKLQADLQAAGSKVGEATAETWPTVSAELETVQTAVKTALAGVPAAATSGQLSN